MALRRKTTNQGGPSHSWRRLEGKGMQRILVLSGIFGVLTFGILFCKLWQLQVVQHEKLENKAITQQTREISSTANRGTIYDANGISWPSAARCRMSSSLPGTCWPR